MAGRRARTDQIPVWLRWSQYLCPLKYGVNLFHIVEFDDCHTDICNTRFDNNDIDRDLWCEMLKYIYLLNETFETDDRMRWGARGASRARPDVAFAVACIAPLYSFLSRFLLFPLSFFGAP